MLLTVFLQFFGIPSFLRYLENKVLVVVDRKETKGIPAPAITFCGIHPKTKAWKKATSLTIALATCNSSSNLFECMESQSWSLEDVVLDAVKGVTVKIPLTNVSFWSSYFLKKKACYTLNLDENIGLWYGLLPQQENALHATYPQPNLLSGELQPPDTAHDPVGGAAICGNLQHLPLSGHGGAP